MLLQDLPNSWLEARADYTLPCCFVVRVSWLNLLIPFGLFYSSPVVVVNNHWHFDARMFIFYLNLLLIWWRFLSSSICTDREVETLCMSPDLTDVTLVSHIWFGHIVIVAWDALWWLDVIPWHLDVLALVDLSVHLSFWLMMVTQFWRPSWLSSWGLKLLLASVCAYCVIHWVLNWGVQRILVQTIV